MPELGHENSSFIEEARKHSKTDQHSRESKLRGIAEDHDEEFLGQGGEVVVFSMHGPESGKVIALNRHDVAPERAKKTYYLQKIFSTLFPNNFPNFALSSGGKKEQSMTVRQRIQAADQPIIKKPFHEILQACEDMGLKFLYDYANDENFVVDEAGNEFYVDSLKSANFSEWGMKKIRAYMEHNGYSKKDVSIIENAFLRLKLLPDTYAADFKAQQDFIANIR